jgi:hypothetical protein
MRAGAVLVAATALIASDSLGGTPISDLVEAAPEPKWEFSLSTYTYLQLQKRDYANPNIIADHDWLDVEVRYNYEALKTGSIWLGYNFTTGKKLKLDLIPMVGGVFGDITGVAPGYTIIASYQTIELSTQGEYFFDAARSANNFFYSWSELRTSPTGWLKVGMVVERTQASGVTSDVRRGPLIGFKYKKKADVSIYWLSPGSHDAAFVFAVTTRF